MNTTLIPHQIDHCTTSHTETVLDGYRVTEGFGAGPGHHRLVCDDNAAVLASLAETGETFDLIFAAPQYNTGRSRDTSRYAFDTTDWQEPVWSRLRPSLWYLASGGTRLLSHQSSYSAACLCDVGRF